MPFNLTFTPTAAQPYSGTVTIPTSYTAVNSNGNYTIAVSGTGVNPGLALSRTSVIWVTQLINTTSPQAYTAIANFTGAAVTIGSITAPTGFAVVANTCPSSLANGAQCSFNLTFTPTVAGPYSGTVTIPTSYTAVNSNGNYTIAASGTGVQ
jgi:hypothetical protein